ncbi:phenylalanine--tRNA ligase subunit beta [Kingella negevensis]|uniref:phenylalanine--tRNA ligase subunit beta n=1 Tax=Kingella negevensis TaxID=1522312 RepID=UPI00254CE947|nr:phenylalanine--tRNA ligase subunit beta [Kingella negevensis]MDK4679976.1 phenylalanine--tRNA ligase subunit beta [Kingella negevensis]MDK4682305.1 phenylalanine--tRNA ligase subunit beta [Kingella negevensis]MDK4690502.1 phenylalanine--tRNA ligase subunit beta [Kingella negevensis]MDK4692150.1 phenylalanine--tRNA ligase subunit beta [Kingella negevensis]MDK4698454.1 phenylalanine--tRNA ligase subunit beta [Kingella negevensis]
MQFSYTWLKTQANPNLSADQLSHLLTMAGLEVEELNAAAPDFSGVVVAEVKSVEKHPDADRLNVTQVDAGTGELIQIVCGAPNVKVGIKVPCALPNALLPNDFKIKPTKMRGVVSNGMLCSAKELGLEDKVDGLLVLPENAPVGQNIREFLDLDDAIFTLKITPNRTDCLSIKGIAREVSALTQCEFNPIQINHIATQTTQKQAVQIDAPNDCGRFISRVISGVNATAASPDWLVQRLERSGIRSISPLVDIGNYVMLEIGQPMHVFDADKISGSLHVRRAKNGEVLDCLNEKTVTLADNTLVIADEQQALSIAGLMGGAASAVSDETKNIVLEAAWFNPLIISGKSRQYGFGSDSSFRFERGVDSELQRDAIERATELVVQICGGEVGEIVEVLGDLPTAKTVEVRTARVEKVLGVSIENQRIETILQHLGLQPEKTADGFRVTAPSFRYDIEIEADLIEEIARVYGYENIPDDYTSGKLAMLKLPENRHSRFGVYQKMAARGFQEVVSYAFVDEQWEQDFANNQDPIRLQNPLAAQYAVMRSTLMGGLIEILQNNLNRKQNRVRVFEIARIFRKENNQFVQTERVGGLVYGSALPEQWGEKSHPVDFYDLKADVETLLRGKNAAFVKAEHSALHPGRCAAIVVDGVNVGIIGELHPKWTQKYDLPQAPLLFELDMDTVLTTEKVRYQAVSKFQAGRRDLAFVLPENVAFADLQAALGQVNNPIIQGIELFDVYRGAGLPENHKSLAVKISLQDMNATLTDETVEPIIQELIAQAETVGAKLR